MENVGNATAIYICPQCGCPDIEISQSALALPASQRPVRCPNCGWKAMLSDAAGIATTEKVFDTKAVLNLLLYVVTKHAAGPVSQALQFIGLIQQGDQEGLDKVMRAATAGMVEQAFMAAAEHAATKKELSERGSSEQEWADQMGLGEEKLRLTPDQQQAVNEINITGLVAQEVVDIENKSFSDMLKKHPVSETGEQKTSGKVIT